MIINIYKYKITTDSNNNLLDNYFDRMPFVDKFTFTKLLENSFPIFQLEYNADDDVTSLRSGFFDVTFSLISGETSDAGLNPEDFFYKDDIFSYRFLCVVSLSENNSFAGMLDLSTLKIDYASTKYTISISCIGILKELSLKFNKTFFNCDVANGYSNFLSFIYVVIFGNFNFYNNTSLFYLKNPNFLEEKVGFPLSFNMFAVGSMFRGNKNLLSFLKDFIALVGCYLDASLKELNPEYPAFYLSFNFRSAQHDVFDAFRIKNQINSFTPASEKFALIETFRYQANTNFISGVFINPITSQVYSLANDFERLKSHDNIVEGSVKIQGVWASFIVDQDDCKIITASEYYLVPDDSIIGAAGYASYIYILNSAAEILEATSALEYKYLIAGNKKSAELKIYFDSPDKLKLFNHVPYENADYVIDRIRDLDANQQTCIIEISKI